MDLWIGMAAGGVLIQGKGLHIYPFKTTTGNK